MGLSADNTAYKESLYELCCCSQTIGRRQEPSAEHHGVKDDNRRENLELFKNHKEHLPSMCIQRAIKELQDRVIILEAETVLLRSLLEGGRDSVPGRYEFKAL